MRNIEFPDEEHAEVTAAIRRTIGDAKYPLSPRLAPSNRRWQARSGVDTATAIGATAAARAPIAAVAAGKHDDRSTPAGTIPI